MRESRHYHNIGRTSPTSSGSNNEAQAPRVMDSGLSCVGVFWTLFSLISMGLSCVGFYMPYWLEGIMMNNTPTYLGLFRRCNYIAIGDDTRLNIVMECGRYTTFLDIPSIWWQIATVTVGVGCGLLMLVAFTAMFGCCMRGIITPDAARVARLLQLLGGLLVGSGCVLYPLGWENEYVRSVCGPEADKFQIGWCHMMWSYYVTISGAAAAMLCSLVTFCAVRKDRVPGIKTSERT